MELLMKSIEDVVKSDLCLGCGLCTLRGNYAMKYSEFKGKYIPAKIRECDDVELKVCPGKGYNIKSSSAQLYSDDAKYSVDLGYVNNQFVVSSMSDRTLQNASSGGVMTQIILYLLEQEIVDYVVVTKFVYTDNGVRTHTFFSNSIEKILEAQGSKYCPVNMDSFIEELDDYKHKKFAFVGTPCQIAAVREIQQFDDAVRKNLMLTIGTFCGGFKSYNNIRKLAKRNGVDYKNVVYFRFRGGGQPGSLLLNDIHGNSYNVDYPVYAGYTGYTKLLRCHLCVDATGELADISCGDAWLEEYIADKKTWSVVLCRNRLASSVLQEMEAEQKIVLRGITDEEICRSQQQNLKSKKYRYESRNRLYRLLGYKLPFFDGGFHTVSNSLTTEMKIYMTHRFKELLEMTGLYNSFRRLIKKKK
jgi:coenzyme F420 hydrogenase subunit beta